MNNNDVLPFRPKASLTPQKEQHQPRIRAANLMILRSLDPEAPPEKWEPIKPDVVPEWIRTKAVANLVKGDMAQNEEKSEAGELVDAYWYRAEQFGVQH